MPYAFTDRGRRVLDEVQAFMRDHVEPAEPVFEEQWRAGGPNSDPPVLEELKAEARRRGLWNLFLPADLGGARDAGLSTVDYAPISEQLGRVQFAPEVLNCSAPDTGNMELLHRSASPELKERWLEPLLAGEIRSAFGMTEPDVASSDASNISLRMARDGDDYVLNGRKWFSTGALSARCQVFIVMGRTDPDAARHQQHSMIVVPRDTPGLSISFEPTIFGYEERGGHPEVVYDDVRVPAANLLGGEGEGFALAQARLGPGRIHHCMRMLGVGERALELLIQRALDRTTFGTRVADQGLVRHWIAESRIQLDMAREYVLNTAALIDEGGARAARSAIAGIKVAVPNIVLQVIDRAIQVHGAAGVTQRTPLAAMYANVRTLRIADGPDEVHEMTIARGEVRRFDRPAT
jgi:acyl-CoA dehydrogenase